MILLTNTIYYRTQFCTFSVILLQIYKSYAKIIIVDNKVGVVMTLDEIFSLDNFNVIEDNDNYIRNINIVKKWR